eukprot:snap_masked-scaffold645_size120276-processed-gene-0.2 protein:Tk11123 transcript:snap_masked-scaffold645_size120276-processed-gene-0.2-mRNA-1 annotation:"uncharacterized protein LOC100162417"
MEADQFREAMLGWLEDSGAVQELRAQVRCRLIQGLRGRHRVSRPPTRAVGAPERALNHLVLEFLVNSGHWLSASVLASEAHFLSQLATESTDAPTQGGPSQPPALAKFPDSSLDLLFRWLRLPIPGASESLRTAYYREHRVSLLQVLLASLSSPAGLSRSPDANWAHDQRRPSPARGAGSHMKDNRLKEALEDSLTSQLSTPESSEAETSPSEASVDSRVASLTQQLAVAHEEIERLHKTRQQLQQFQTTVEAQSRALELDRWCLDSPQPPPNREPLAEPGPAVGSTSLDHFLSQTRQKVRGLYLSGVDIDQAIVP